MGSTLFWVVLGIMLIFSPTMAGWYVLCTALLEASGILNPKEETEKE